TAGGAHSHRGPRQRRGRTGLRRLGSGGAAAQPPSPARGSDAQRPGRAHPVGQGVDGVSRRDGHSSKLAPLGRLVTALLAFGTLACSARATTITVVHRPGVGEIAEVIGLLFDLDLDGGSYHWDGR